MWGIILGIITFQTMYVHYDFYNIFTPLVYNFVRNDTAYALSVDGYLYPFVLRKDTLGGRVNFSRVDSIDLGKRNIKTALFFNDTLILGTKNGVFLISDRNSRGISPIRAISLFHNNGKIYMLGDRELQIFPGSRKWPITGRFIFGHRNEVLVSGRGSVYRISSKPKLIYRNSQFDYFGWDGVIKFNPILKFDLAASGRRGVMIFVGYNKKDKESLIAYIPDDGSPIKKIVRTGLVSAIAFNNGRYWVLLEKDGITHLNVIEEESLAIMDSFRFGSLLSSIVRLNNEYWLIFGSGISYLFKETNFNKFYNIVYTPSERIFSSPILYDFDNDGDEDLMLLVTSTTSYVPLREKAWGVVFVENKISESLNKAIEEYKDAKEQANLLYCEDARVSIDLALETFNVLLPESLDNTLKLRANIYKIVDLRNRLKKIATGSFHFLIYVLFPLLVIVLLYLKYQREREQTRTPPSAFSIDLLLSMNMFHKFSSKWYPLVEKQDVSENEIKKLLEEIGEIIGLLSTPRIKYEFKDSKRKWRRIYKKLMIHLTQLKYILKVGKMIPCLSKLCMKMIKINIHKIGELRNEFKRLAESIEEDVVAKAVLPVVEKIRKRLSGIDIQVIADVKTEVPFLYYPDEIKELRTALEAVIENAVESFEGYKPEDHPTIEIKVRSSVSELLIEIKDNGKGIPKDVLSRIFEEGFSYGKSGRGRGMGLSAAKKIFEKYGEIKIESVPNEGTKVTIKLIFGKRKDRK